MIETLYETIKFLEEIGFAMDTLIIDYKYFSISFTDENMEQLFNAFFPFGIQGFGDNKINSIGIWAFRTDEEFINYLKTKYKERYTEVLAKNKCNFLKSLGIFPEETTTKEICSSPKFEELNKFYQDIATKGHVHCKKAIAKVQGIFGYQEELSKKLDALKSKYPEQGKEYYKEISKLCMVNGNYKGNASVDLLSTTNEHFVETVTENGEIKDIIIFFCPFFYYHLDLHLRHEIRHALTTTSRRITDDIEEIKVGNRIQVFQNGTLISEILNDYNEYVTQYEAIKETKESYERGIYILSPEGEEFSRGATTSYDEYLPYFEILYKGLPASAKRSQIEDSNDSLYRVVSENTLIQYEALINNKDAAALNSITLPETLEERNR
ncbi:MAG: hypothetical protein K2M17_04775 [Bacilli bacterium]|nr:hypothetical protein [Bacilli bacterium]